MTKVPFYGVRRAPHETKREQTFQLCHAPHDSYIWQHVTVLKLLYWKFVRTGKIRNSKGQVNCLHALVIPSLRPIYGSSVQQRNRKKHSIRRGIRAFMGGDWKGSVLKLILANIIKLREENLRKVPCIIMVSFAPLCHRKNGSVMAANKTAVGRIKVWNLVIGIIMPYHLGGNKKLNY